MGGEPAPYELAPATRRSLCLGVEQLFYRVQRAIHERRPGDLGHELAETVRERVEALAAVQSEEPGVWGRALPQLRATTVSDVRYDGTVLTGRVLCTYHVPGGAGAVVQETWTVARARPDAAFRCPRCGAVTNAGTCPYCGCTDPLREGFLVRKVEGPSLAGFAMTDPGERIEPAAETQAQPAALGIFGDLTSFGVTMFEGRGKVSDLTRHFIRGADPGDLEARAREKLERLQLRGWGASPEIGTIWDLTVRVLETWHALVAAQRQRDPALVARHLAPPLYERFARPIVNATLAPARAAGSTRILGIELLNHAGLRDVHLGVAYGPVMGHGNTPEWQLGPAVTMEAWHLRWGRSASQEPDKCVSCGGDVEPLATQCPYCGSAHTQRESLVLLALERVDAA